MERLTDMFSKERFIVAHQIGDIRFYPTYKNILQSQWKLYSEQKEDQEKQLRKMVNFAYNNVPYYHKLFLKLKLTPSDINGVEDLEKMPILTKEIIKNNWEDFKPINLGEMKFYTNSTGGSTGTPFRYRLLKYDRFLSGAMLYKGWGYAGYELGDRMVFLAGASLDVGLKSNLITKVHEIARNIRKLSSFDMSEEEMGSYSKIIESFKPKFIRGYASSLYLFSKWIQKNDFSIHTPSAIFTTAEKLHPHMRKAIEDVFDCKVYDGYGLNDGGVGAYECSEHSGLHIDTERSIMEVVDKDDHQLDEGEGRILATTLHNYAMPFMRYDTGDVGHIISESCNCGRGYKLLKELVGRSVDILITPEGKNVHGWFFLYIFWEHCEGIKEYQVVQESLNNIIIKLVPEDNFDMKQLDTIIDIIHKKSPRWIVEFKFLDKIETMNSGKYKFIINNMRH